MPHRPVYTQAGGERRSSLFFFFFPRSLVLFLLPAPPPLIERVCARSSCPFVESLGGLFLAVNLASAVSPRRAERSKNWSNRSPETRYFARAAGFDLGCEDGEQMFPEQGTGKCRYHHFLLIFIKYSINQSINQSVECGMLCSP